MAAARWPAGLASFARPKSRIFAGPRLTRKMLAGLMSRWTMPLAWAASRRVGDLECRGRAARRCDGLAGDAMLQGLAFEQLHGDEGPAFEFADIVNRADVGMIQ